MSSYPIQKAVGFTDAERYLSQLCERSFLSLWSYPSVFRDQGGASGKEICDLLVTFGDDVLIFADKQCAFPRSGSLDLDWSRWFKRAILGNTRQILGAERWIKSFPNRLFLDPKCTQPFPLRIPDPKKARFHRIVVAHGVSQRCREALGGNGGLSIVPGIVGKDHYINSGNGLHLFCVGTIEEGKGFVHVLDDESLEVLMRTLDTVNDFVAYLRKKESFLAEGALASAASEQELLAYYLLHRDSSGEHYFAAAPRTSLTLLEGLWEQLNNDQAWKAEILNNRVSYFWDQVIERFSVHALAGTEYFTSGILGAEAVLRLMAHESRGRRRFLSLGLGQFLRENKHATYAARVLPAATADEPYYVFVHASKPHGVTDEEYRRGRLGMLQSYCAVTKYLNPDARHVVGIATCADSEQNCSEDAIALDIQNWGEAQNEEARRIQAETGLLTKATRTHISDKALLRQVRTPIQQMRGAQRNQPCPCGSGKKFKKCHGV